MLFSAQARTLSARARRACCQWTTMLTSVCGRKETRYYATWNYEILLPTSLSKFFYFLSFLQVLSLPFTSFQEGILDLHRLKADPDPAFCPDPDSGLYTEFNSNFLVNFSRVNFYLALIALILSKYV
jgi:hypothetical protein